MNKKQNMSAVIDRIAAIRQEQDALKTEYEQLLAKVEADAEKKLADTKNKSVSYTSASGNSIIFTNADSINITAGELLKEIFGVLSDSMYSTELKYSLKAPAKKLINAILSGEYCEGSVAEIISSLPCDDGTKKVLSKKIKGADFEKDKSTLMNAAELSEQEASDTAYLIYEAAAWENICKFITSTHDGKFSAEILNDIKGKLTNAVSITRSTRTKLIIAGDGT